MGELYRAAEHDLKNDRIGCLLLLFGLALGFFFTFVTWAVVTYAFEQWGAWVAGPLVILSNGISVVCMLMVVRKWADRQGVYNTEPVVPAKRDEAAASAAASILITEPELAARHAAAVTEGYKDEFCPRCGALLMAHHNFVRCTRPTEQCPMRSKILDRPVLEYVLAD